MNRFVKSILLCSSLILTGCNTSDSKPHQMTTHQIPPGNIEELTPTEKDEKTTLFTGNVMTIDYRILIGQLLSADDHKKIDKLISDTFKHVDLTYNKWNPHSEVSKLNRLKAGISASISTELERFLNQVDTIVTLTEGRFDPTIEPLQQLWKDRLEKGSVPTECEVEAMIPLVGWKNIHFGQQLFSKDHDLTQMDFGGIAKGLCVDLLVEKLNANGFPNLYVEWGGEIRTTGRHPEGRAWTVFISQLGDIDPNHAIALIPLQDAALATSGDYQQNWTINTLTPTTYFHIIDPWTFQPLKIDSHTIASASVCASNCVLADGLATAAMIFSNPSEAQAWGETIKRDHPELNFWFASRKSLQVK